MTEHSPATETLLEALRSGYYPEKAAQALAEGADPNVRRSGSSDTLLHEQVVRGHDDLCALLLSHGADPSAKGLHGHTPLHNAVFENSLSIAKMLLEKGADVNAAARGGFTPLHAAINMAVKLKPNQELIELLLQHDADPELICTYIALDENMQSSQVRMTALEHARKTVSQLPALAPIVEGMQKQAGRKSGEVAARNRRKLQKTAEGKYKL